MSWLLFLDESGHDHRTMPYEVRGGVALHAGELWSFVQDVQRLELASFGTELHQFRSELKGCKLLAKRPVQVGRARIGDVRRGTAQALSGFSHQGAGEEAAVAE